MRTNVSVIVPARNDAPSLRESVTRCLGQRGVVIDDLVIAVGPSSDGTEDVARKLAAEFLNVQVIENPRGITPTALNEAIAATAGEIIVRVDARSLLPEQYIEHAVETLQETGAGNVGAIQRPVGLTPMQKSIASAMRSRFGSGGPAYRGTDHRCRVKTAYLGVFQRKALIDVGGYDEAFIRNQDAELNIRLRSAGYEVWLDPRLVVDYYPRATLRKLAIQFWQYGWWRQRTVHKHRSSLQLRQLPAPALVVTVAAATITAVVISPLALLVPAGYLSAMLAIALAGTGSFLGRIRTAAALVTMQMLWGAGFLSSMTASVLRLHKE